MSQVIYPKAHSRLLLVRTKNAAKAQHRPEPPLWQCEKQSLVLVFWLDIDNDVDRA